MKLRQLIDAWLEADRRRDATWTTRRDAAAAHDAAATDSHLAETALVNATVSLLKKIGRTTYQLADGRFVEIDSSTMTVSIVEPVPLPDDDIPEQIES